MGCCSKVAALAIIFGTWGCAAQSTASNNSSDSSAGSSSAVSEPTLTPSSSSSGQDVLPVSSAVAESTSSSSTPSSSSSSSGVAPQQSPAWLASVTPLPNNVQAYPADGSNVPTGPLSSGVSVNTQAYPAPWTSPPIDSPDVQAVIKAIDWSQVPQIPVRKAGSDGSVSVQGYDATTDPDCWWTATGCTQPKVSGIPPDVRSCPKAGDWGLTYDDGPLTAEGGGQYAEPHLYDFLVQQKQKAGLFYIGSNVITAPAAAQRALADGHTLCLHTWSHPSMTSQKNEQVVAELYWNLRAIKEVTGVTPRCWRPPYGDVDDRVRAIAWQMGLSTVLWDMDTFDWSMTADQSTQQKVDDSFTNWIAARKNGSDNASGHIVLQHELNSYTVSKAEKWLPEIKQVFNVVPWNECINVAQPYWEQNFVYPTDANPNPQVSQASNGTVPKAPASAGAETNNNDSNNANSAASALLASGQTAAAKVISVATVIAVSLIYI